LETVKLISIEVKKVELLLLQPLETGRNLLGRLSRQRGELVKLEKEEPFQMVNLVCLIDNPAGSVHEKMVILVLR
jgi:hypothetical protein